MRCILRPPFNCHRRCRDSWNDISGTSRNHVTRKKKLRWIISDGTNSQGLRGTGSWTRTDAEGFHIKFLRTLMRMRMLYVHTNISPYCTEVGMFHENHVNIRFIFTLHWRHSERYGVSNHRRLQWANNCSFRRRSKKTSELRVTGLCAGNSPVTSEFPAQKASNVENVSIWWRHHESTSRVPVSCSVVRMFRND